MPQWIKWLLPGVATLVAVPATAAGDAERGEREFQRCYACHSVKEGETDLTGPNLKSVIGRKAASLEGFAYSPAMRGKGAAGLVWTERTLDVYLMDPEAMVPGTVMIFNGLPDPRDRADVIAYLKRAGQ